MKIMKTIKSSCCAASDDSMKTETFISLQVKQTAHLLHLLEFFHSGFLFYMNQTRCLCLRHYSAAGSWLDKERGPIRNSPFFGVFQFKAILISAQKRRSTNRKSRGDLCSRTSSPCRSCTRIWSRTWSCWSHWSSWLANTPASQRRARLFLCRMTRVDSTTWKQIRQRDKDTRKEQSRRQRDKEIGLAHISVSPPVESLCGSIWC